MQVNFSADIARLIAEQPFGRATDDDGSFEVEPSMRRMASGAGDARGDLEDLIAEFRSQLVRSSVMRDDLGGSGLIDRGEVVNQNLAPRPTYRFSKGDVARTWDQIDRDGLGRLDQTQYASGFSDVFKLSAGRLDKPLA